MSQSHRSLESMSACSGVTVCLSEGAVECSFVSAKCPPCVYALTGGDYSCYSRETSGKCPFSGTYVECDGLPTSGSATSTSRTSGMTTAPSTEARAVTTPSTKTPSNATPETPAGANKNSNLNSPTSSDNSPSSAHTVVPGPSTITGSDASETSATPASNSDAPQTPATPASGPDPTQKPATPSFDVLDSTQSSDGEAHEKVMANSVKSSASTPTAANLVLVGGAVALVAVVMVFVVRRAMSKKKLTASAGPTVLSGHSSAWSDRTLNAEASGGNIYSTYGYKNDDKLKDISMLDSQASTTFGSGVYGQTAALSRTTADFSKYGGNSQYTASSQYYTDYSMSTGPEHAAAGAAAGEGAALLYSNKSAAASIKTGNNFVDVTGSTTSMRGSELDPGPSQPNPLTVSQLMPKGINEHKEEGFSTRRRPEKQQYESAQSSFYHLHSANAAGPSNSSSQMFGVSTASSMYDIVDPMTMLDVEARSTEMLAEDNQYPKFSFASAASSGIYDGDWSEDESNDGSRVVEHMI